jgi:ADP-heptose:LPS heptosyltransferase
MTPVIECLPAGGRVLCVRLRSLGDCVLTTPALRLLKQSRPDLKITVMAEPRFHGVFEGNPDVDRILPPGALHAAVAFPHLAINLHGGPRSAALTAASLARRRAGFAHFRFQPLYNLRIPRAQEILGLDRKVHTAEHVASAMFWLGVPRGEIPRARLFTGAVPPPARPYAVLHPAASAPDKTWPAEKFLAVARHLEAECGLQAVFIGGPGDDLSPFAGHRVVKAAPLGEVKELLSRASLFAGNDSGPAHMAAAFGLPAVVLFGASDPEVWGPWRTPHEIVAAPEGLRDVPAGRVIEALERLRARV